MDDLVKLMGAYDRQNTIIRLQAEVISELFGLLSLHISSEELDKLDTVAKINIAADLRKEIEWPE